MTKKLIIASRGEDLPNHVMNYQEIKQPVDFKMIQYTDGDINIVLFVEDELNNFQKELFNGLSNSKEWKVCYNNTLNEVVNYKVDTEEALSIA